MMKREGDLDSVVGGTASNGVCVCADAMSADNVLMYSHSKK